MFMHPYIGHEIIRARQRDLREHAARQRLATRLRGHPRTSGHPRTGRHHGSRALVSALAAAVALVLVVVLAGCGGGHGGTGTGGHSGNGAGAATPGAPGAPATPGAPGAPGTSGAPTLAGEWIGQPPGDEGDCGTGSGEWIFDPDNGTYQFDAIYDSGQCGYQSNGTYQVDGDSIYFQPTDESGFYETYGFEDGALVLCDVPDSAQCSYYYSQPMQ